MSLRDQFDIILSKNLGDDNQMIKIGKHTSKVCSSKFGILTSVSNGNHLPMSGNRRISVWSSELMHRVYFIRSLKPGHLRPAYRRSRSNLWSRPTVLVLLILATKALIWRLIISKSKLRSVTV